MREKLRKAEFLGCRVRRLEDANSPVESMIVREMMNKLSQENKNRRLRVLLWDRYYGGYYKRPV